MDRYKNKFNAETSPDSESEAVLEANREKSGIGRKLEDIEGSNLKVNRDISGEGGGLYISSQSPTYNSTACLLFLSKRAYLFAILTVYLDKELSLQIGRC